MPQQRSNKAQTPINSDAFNLTPDLATMADTLGVIVSVADRTEGDSVATARAAAGWPVTDARPLYVWNLATKTIDIKGTSGWRGGERPFGHMGRNNSFQSLGGVTTTVIMSAAQELRGGFTFDNANDALVIPFAGLYDVHIKAFFTGATTGLNQSGIYVNGSLPSGQYQGLTGQSNKMDSSDITYHTMSTVSFSAGDKVALWHQSSVSTWGTNGYDGAYLQIKYSEPF